MLTHFALLAAMLLPLSARAQTSALDELLAVETSGFTGGLARHHKTVAEHIVFEMRPRFPEMECPEPGPGEGELVSLGDAPQRGVLPAGVDPDLARLAAALDHPSREVRDLAAYTIGLIGPAARDLGGMLESHFGNAITMPINGWINFAYERVLCQATVAVDFRRAIPAELLPPDEPWGEFLEQSAMLMANLYLDPNAEYPPDMMGYAYGNYALPDRAGAAVPLLAEILVGEQLSFQKRFEAAQALSRVDAELLNSVLPQLTEAMNNESEAVRYYVGEALVRMRSDLAIPLLVERISDTDDWYWENELCDYGPAAISAEDRLLTLMGNATIPANAYHATEVLGCVRSLKAIPVLTTLLSNTDWKMVEVAAQAIGEIGQNPPETTAALISTARSHWSIRVKRVAWAALQKIGVSVPEPQPFYGQIDGEELFPVPEVDAIAGGVTEIMIGGLPGPHDHGLVWCDESGPYSVDGSNWFMVEWIKPELEPAPADLPQTDVLIQGVGTQTFLRVDDGWLFGSNGFESTGVLAHISDAGVGTTIDWWDLAINAIARADGKIYASGFEIGNVGDGGSLFELSRDTGGIWTSERVAILPSYPWYHALSPGGHLLLSDGPNDYAIIENRIVPLQCEKTRPESYFADR